MAPAGQVTGSDLRAMLTDGALAGSWTLDASRSSISLRSKSVWGLAPVKGSFREIAGTGTVSPDGQVSGTITVAAASVDTKNAKRDAHLRSAEFFDADAHPRITVRDLTRPLTFGATVSTPNTGEIWLDAEIQVNRADYGMTWSPMHMASMDNTITIHAVFTHS